MPLVPVVSTSPVPMPPLPVDRSCPMSAVRPALSAMAMRTWRPASGWVRLDVDGQLLTIRAERTPRSDEGVKWLAHERPSGSFLRQLNLGDGIATDQISANYDNGVLSVMIPVSEKAKPRKVAITANGGPRPVAVEN